MIDLSSGNVGERIVATKQAIQSRQPVIYQGVLNAYLPDTEDQVLGIPDFLISRNGSYIIRDCKLSRHAEEESHPEILRQLGLYGWLYEKTVGAAPEALEALLGDGSTVQVSYSALQLVLGDLAQIRRVSTQTEALYIPVGWSKCSGCSFHEYCWHAAEARDDVALLPDVDQAAATVLHDQGIETISDLLNGHDEISLAAIQRPWGKRVQRIGTKSASILRQAQAARDKTVLKVMTMDLDLGSNVVMFDLEGMPPYLDEFEKVYLWGVQVFGKHSSDYHAALSGFGEDGDRNG